MTDRIKDHSKEIPTIRKITCQKVQRTGEAPHTEGEALHVEEDVVCEHELEISVNGMPAFRLTCTPEHLKELVLGRLLTAGLIRCLEDVEHLFICGEGNIAEVRLREGIQMQDFSGSEPTCCTGNRQYLQGNEKPREEPFSAAVPEPEVIFRMAEHFRKDSALHKITGGTHSCYVRFGDGRILSFEDIGRHNALDKAVGALLLEEEDPLAAMLYTSGRVPADMVEKVIRAGIPVLISKSVPTDRGVLLAKEYGLMLICRAREDSYWITTR